MSRKTRSLMGIAVSAVVALGLAACGGGTGGDTKPGESEKPTGESTVETEKDVTLTMAWWGNDDRADKYQQSVALFTEKYPNIKVQTSFAAWDDYWTARNTEAASKSLPDVMQMDLSYIRQYGNTGQLLDLTPHIGQTLDVSGVEPGLLASGELGGAQVGVPTSQNTLALFINQDITTKYGIDLPEAGYTWEEYNDFVIEVSKAGAGEDPKVFGGGDYAGTFWFFIQWLIQQDIEPFTDDGNINFTEAQMTEWLNIAAPVRDGFVPSSERITQLLPLGPFTALESASEFTWDNFLAGYVADSGTENFAMLPIPTGKDGVKNQFFKPSMLLTGSASSKHPAEAAALIDFLINDPKVGEIFGTSKGVPATAAQRDAMIIEEGSIDAKVMAFEAEFASEITGKAPIPVEGFGAIEAEYKRLSEEFGYGKIDVDEFVKLWFAEAALTVGK